MKPAAKSAPRVPFGFVFDHLLPLEPRVKPMFGCHALYVGKRLVIVVRQREVHSEANGVWLATKREHHESLKKVLPSMQSVPVLGTPPTNWQMLPETGRDFESEVINLCSLIVRGDPRIGTIPAVKRSSKRTSAPRNKRRSKRAV